jgi:hypothetical protein
MRMDQQTIIACTAGETINLSNEQNNARTVLFLHRKSSLLPMATQYPRQFKRGLFV